MHAFACPSCHGAIHFEMRLCPHCQATLGYDPATDSFRHLSDGATQWRDGAGLAREVVVCANNNEHAICNWLVEPQAPGRLCRACRHNRTVPDTSQSDVPARWKRIEEAKRRLFHTLLKLGLPLETKAEEAPGRQGLAFDFLYDPAAETTGRPQILTGHDSGLVTLNLIEADDAERERMRIEMGEPYRTLLGHFRHEVGHHYWSRLVAPDPQALAEFRRIFGDERQNYAQALQDHYQASTDTAWTDAYVSPYAMAHPWEDFAETWAHYLHIVDLEATAASLTLSLSPPGSAGMPTHLACDFDPYRASAATLAKQMGPLAFTLNSLNRAMGLGDAYPFRLSDTIVAKLDFIARLVAQSRVGDQGLSP